MKELAAGAPSPNLSRFHWSSRTQHWGLYSEPACTILKLYGHSLVLLFRTHVSSFIFMLVFKEIGFQIISNSSTLHP